MARRSEAANQTRRKVAYDEVVKARAAKSASKAYSAKCASLRVMKCAWASEAAEMSGKSQRSRGPITREVSEADIAPVEA